MGGHQTAKLMTQFSRLSQEHVQQELANVCEGPERKHFGLCRPAGLCCHSTNVAMDRGKQTGMAASRETLVTKAGGRPDLARATSTPESKQAYIAF